MSYSFKLPYGLRLENGEEKLLHISEIQPSESGLKCRCVCPKCGARLQAKLPKTKKDFTPRFAHHHAETCDYATETAIHLKAKEIIEKEKRLIIPSVEASYKNLSKELSPSKEIHFDRVILERKVDDIIPDIMVYKNNRPLMIEIKITHGIDKIKYKKIKKIGISTLEIELTNMKNNFDPESLRKALINITDNKHWIYNTRQKGGKRELKQKYLELKEREQEEMRKAEEKRLRLKKKQAEERARKEQRVAQLLDQNYQAEQRLQWGRNFQRDPIWIKTARLLKLKGNNVPVFLNLEIPGDFVFGCDRRIWQSHIFCKYVNNKVKLFGEDTFPISVKYILNQIKKDFKKTMIRDLVYLKDNDGYKDLPGLSEVLYAYLKQLETYGFLEEESSKHHYHSRFIILDPDSLYEMRFLPSDFPDRSYLEYLVKNKQWELCKEVLTELLIKYNSNRHYEYYMPLVSLFNRVVAKSEE